VPSDFETAATASGLAVDLAPLKTRWDMLVNDALAEATLQRPPASSSGTAAIPQGKNGLHSGYLGPLLADMQVLARQHPEATW
jgi:ring-1,2-phenylacetyl-CoA epoxidase subunit PaaC